MCEEDRYGFDVLSLQLGRRYTLLNLVFAVTRLCTASIEYPKQQIHGRRCQSADPRADHHFICIRFKFVVRLFPLFNRFLTFPFTSHFLQRLAHTITTI